MLGTRLAARIATLALVGGGLAVITGGGTAHATGTPALSVADVTTTEGNFGTASIRVPVTLSEPSAVRIKVPYTISAAPGNTDPRDSYILKGTVTFAIGVVSRYVTVASPGDTAVEPDQRIQVELGTPIGGPATMQKGIGIVTLTDDDASGLPPSQLTVSIGDVSMDEGDAGIRTGYIPVTLSAPAPVLTKVGFAIDCNTAGLLTDISIAKRGTIAFQIGQQSKFIAFRLNPDATPDENRDLAEGIQAQAKTAVVLDNRGDAEINDDDGRLPAISGHPVPNFQAESLPSASSFDGQAVGDREMLDVTPSGAPGTEPYLSRAPSLSYDGRYAAFISPRPNLVAGDTNGLPDVFVRDRQTGTTELVSRQQDGTPISGPPGTYYQWATISADGRYVGYDTNVALDPHDTNVNESSADVYVYDRVAHTTELVSQDNTGAAMGRIYYANSISAHGRYVMFSGVPASTGIGIYVRDRVAGTTTKIYDAPKVISDAVLSANGRIAVIPAEATGCLAPDLVAIDLVDGSAERVDMTDGGDAAVQDYEIWYNFYKPSISGDGRYVAFNDDSWNLVPGLTEQPWHSGAFNSNTLHVYVRDLVDKSTTMIGMGVDGSVPQQIGFPGQTEISWDGNVVLSVEEDAGASYAWNRATGTATLLGMQNTDYPYPAVEAEVWWHGPQALSGDGRYVGYTSFFHTDPLMSDASASDHVWIQRLG